jgi:hypothetical protein
MEILIMENKNNSIIDADFELRLQKIENLSKSLKIFKKGVQATSLSQRDKIKLENYLYGIALKSYCEK